MKFSRLANALLFVAVVGCAAHAQTPRATAPRRSNELTLAGLRPGRDNLANALKRYKAKLVNSASPIVKEWHDACTGHSLMLDIDDRMVIQTVTVSALAPRDAKCDDRHLDAFDMGDWVTGLGLHLNDSQDRVIALYGEPSSTGPSVKGERELEFLYYAFDWAGSDVPQVLEVYCARDTGKVVEITLAYPSL
jgi:hypothetical protein